MHTAAQLGAHRPRGASWRHHRHKNHHCPADLHLYNLSDGLAEHDLRMQPRAHAALALHPAYTGGVAGAGVCTPCGACSDAEAGVGGDALAARGPALRLRFVPQQTWEGTGVQLQNRR